MITMKIAYIFHGHSRTWKECHQSFFDNVFSVAPGDIFIHTWDKVNALTGSAWNGWSDLDGGQLEVSNQYADLSGIFSTYKPKILITEEHPIVDISKYHDQRKEFKANYAVKNMLHSRRKIFEESQRYGNYNFYFNTRLDIKYENKLDPNEITLDKLFVPNEARCDIFMHGPARFIDIHSRYYFDIDNFWFNSNLYKNDLFYERVLLQYLEKKGLRLNVEIFRSSLKYSMPRIF